MIVVIILLGLAKLIHELTQAAFTSCGKTEKRDPSINIGREDQVFFRYPGFHKIAVRLSIYFYYELYMWDEYIRNVTDGKNIINAIDTENTMNIFLSACLVGLTCCLHLKIYAVVSLEDEYFHGVRPYKKLEKNPFIYSKLYHPQYLAEFLSSLIYCVLIDMNYPLMILYLFHEIDIYRAKIHLETSLEIDVSD